MSHYNLGCTNQAAGKLDEAMTNYRNAIAEDASFCDAHYNLANGTFSFTLTNDLSNCVYQLISVFYL